MNEPRNTQASGRALLHGELTEQVIGAFFEVHKILRHGYLESTYAGALALELKATRAVGDADKRQIVHYLRATNTRVGLLLHFAPQANFFRIINSKRGEERPG